MNQANASISSTQAPQVGHDEISRHAQELWEKYGRPSGRDEEIWLEAERNLLAQRSSHPSPAGAPSTAKPALADVAPPPPSPRAGRSSGATASPRMPGSRSRKG